MDDLYAALLPVMGDVGLELVDVEQRTGVLLVTVDRPGGVDLDALAEANRAASAVLDELDPIPGRYALEVSSPGLERTLRTPAHFSRAVGETVTVKTRPETGGERRRRGRLLSADETGFELETEGGAEVSERLAYTDVERARTVFEWGSGPRADPKSRAGSKKRKQVTSR